jgi:hypothetical protein
LWSASAAIVLISGFAFADVGEKNFSLQTTRDLYELCSASTDHPDYAPAIYSCRSFLEATVQYHDAVSDGKTLKRLICYPPTATLEDARVAFVAWAKANERSKALMKEMPVMGVVRALEDKYPCKG